ncbi:hypothetical protein HanPI659440_Chr11g0411331 [Helianthus annuus]|nr:hypothetical protein HanPI659440_Chr11g0411331 [Helianthus annuus]
MIGAEGLCVGFKSKAMRWVVFGGFLVEFDIKLIGDIVSDEKNEAMTESTEQSSIGEERFSPENKGLRRKKSCRVASTSIALQEQKNASTSAGLYCPVGESSSYKCIPAERTEENHLSFNLNDQIAPLEFMWKGVSKQLLTLNINSYQAFLHIKWGRMKTQIRRFTSRR